MSEPLRQPLTFWQWITGQPGTIYTPPAPPAPPRPLTALDYIERELVRVHDQIDNFRSDDSFGENEDIVQSLVERLDKLHDELARRSQNETIPAR